MKPSIFVPLLGLLVSRTVAQSSSVPSATVALGAIQTLGCYQSAGNLVKANTNTYQTSGLCQQTCGNEAHAVMATTGGSTCYCGDELPALDQEVDIAKCNSPCQGYDPEMCGGIGAWTVYLTGLGGDVQTQPNSTSSSSAAPSGASSTTATASKAPATVVVTASAIAQPTESASGSKNGPNKVGIAVGVVVGVIVIAALAGALVYFLKQKKKREILEEHKAQAAVNTFVGSRGSDQKSDARLDPSMASSFRRESIGSIADERDFSRRILQV